MWYMSPVSGSSLLPATRSTRSSSGTCKIVLLTLLQTNDGTVMRHVQIAVGNVETQAAHIECTLFRLARLKQMQVWNICRGSAICQAWLRCHACISTELQIWLVSTLSHCAAPSMLTDAKHMPEVPVNQQHDQYDKAIQRCQTWQGQRIRHMPCRPRFDFSMNTLKTSTRAQLSLNALLEGIQAMRLWQDTYLSHTPNQSCLHSRS